MKNYSNNNNNNNILFFPIKTEKNLPFLNRIIEVVLRVIYGGDFTMNNLLWTGVLTQGLITHHLSGMLKGLYNNV